MDFLTTNLLALAAAVDAAAAGGGTPESVGSGAGVWSLVVAAGVLAAGLVLLIFGRQLLRPLLLIGGLGVGAGAGLLLAATLQPPVPPWTVALAGAIVMGVIALLMYRPALGFGLAALLGLAGPIAVVSWAEYRGVNVLNPPIVDDEEHGELGEHSPPPPSARDDFNRLLDGLHRTVQLMREADDAIEDVRRFRDRGDPPPPVEGEREAEDEDEDESAENDENAMPVSAEEAIDWISHLASVAEDARNEFGRRWDAAPNAVRRSIVLSGVCCVIFGLLIGLFAPVLGAMLVSAMVGSALSLLGAGALHDMLGLQFHGWLPQSGMQWMTVWLIVAALGMAVQWTIFRRPADKPRGKRN